MNLGRVKIFNFERKEDAMDFYKKHISNPQYKIFLPIEHYRQTPGGSTERVWLVKRQEVLTDD